MKSGVTILAGLLTGMLVAGGILAAFVFVGPDPVGLRPTPAPTLIPPTIAPATPSPAPSVPASAAPSAAPSGSGRPSPAASAATAAAEAPGASVALLDVRHGARSPAPVAMTAGRTAQS